MGGRIAIEFLERRPDILDRMAGLVLIDPTLRHRMPIEPLRSLLDRDTLLVASHAQPDSPGRITSALLEIPAAGFPGIHGEMPNRALNRILDFYEQRLRAETGNPQEDNE